MKGPIRALKNLIGAGDSPARAADLLDRLTEDVAATGNDYWRVDATSLPTIEEVRALDPNGRAEFVRTALVEYSRAAAKFRGRDSFDGLRAFVSSSRPEVDRVRMQACEGAARMLLRSAIRCDPERVDGMCQALTAKRESTYQTDAMEAGLLKTVELHEGRLTAVMREWLCEMVKKWVKASKPDMPRVKRARTLLGEAPRVSLEPGEVWSDAAIVALSEVAASSQSAWVDLIDHCMASGGSSPSAKWSKAAQVMVAAVGKNSVEKLLLEWFPLVDRPRRTAPGNNLRPNETAAYLIVDAHMEALKGLCWIAAMMPSPEMARTVGRLAVTCYRKVPGIGPRAVKVGNAAVYALGQMPGRDALGQLALLRVKVKFGTAQKMIEKALGAAAAREGLPADEIEELAVPAYGMTEVGRRVEDLGGHRVEVVAVGVGDVELRFFKRDGKPVKSAPSALKSEFADDLKELKASAKDVAAMLSAQRERIDSLFVHDKSWPVGVWRERYLDHPLVGVLARRLIWRIESGKEALAATWSDEGAGLVDVAGKRVDVATDARVKLWHPIGLPTDEVLGWRKYFEDRQIKQPFKQAHREVYLLTDAERRTGTYSNRFAAHIVRQHQFNALCGLRGWKNKLRLMVDAEYPPASRELAAWGLRAEFWIEGAGAEYGQDTNDAGVYNLLTTDQVRFYRTEAAQAYAHAGGGGYGAGWRGETVAPGLRLEEVPALVFSEIMRDVDLFVGVGSVGNNPAWNDGGPDGAHRDYWWGYSFGDLAESGKNRRDVLSRLLPRLKIAPVCELVDKFLRVRGTKRVYKIHLGSGNILMEPNDQYLCIVPGRSDEAAKTGVFLPFEGDRTLAIILSKAFMLAADDKISDPSIVSQIGRGK